MRKKTRQVFVGSVAVGGDAPITVQSMTTTPTSDVEKTVAQILAMEEEGCDITRSAINSLEDAKAIPEIKKRTNIPLVADIQFDYKLALYAVEYGCDCLRINPGNIGSREHVEELVAACKEKQIPIRIGVNSGSVHRDMIEKYGGVNVESLVYSALDEVKILEECDFYDIVVSIKSSDVRTMIDAYRLFSEKSDYPLHLGVTEAGPAFQGTIKSAVGIGTLLAEGIGDTIRVSITGDPVQEITIGKEILKSLGLRRDGIDIVSCPTCSRTTIPLLDIVEEVQRRAKALKKDLKIAIMGCPVNGPGEAKEADLGIAGAKGQGIIFRKGKVIKRCKQEDLIDELMKVVENFETEDQ